MRNLEKDPNRKGFFLADASSLGRKEQNSVTLLRANVLENVGGSFDELHKESSLGQRRLP